jgi:hypothetical protein
MATIDRQLLSASQILRQQFELIYATAELNLRHMTMEHSVIQPEPAGNPANWLLAHLIQIQNGVMWLVGQPPVWTDPRIPRVGLVPPVDPASPFDWDAMCSSLIASRDRCLDAIASLSDEQLTETLPDPFGGVTTRVELLGVLANHQPYHIGQLGLIRRLVGLPGEIRGPSE